ncbi:MAG: cell wall hydrolase [Lachnospiraceae bacterium]|nr:cell wall hydrolase [Lachnospiraceae bacterium]
MICKRTKTARAVLCICLALLLAFPVFADETTIDVGSGEVSGPDGGADPTDEPPMPVSEPEPDSATIMGRYFTPQESMTGQKLEDARRDKANAEAGLTRTEDVLEDLQTESADVQTYLIQVDQKLREANEELQEYEELVDDKERSIQEAIQTVKDAKEQQVVRKENMKGRIKYMYEQGSESYVDILLNAKSFSDFLNKSAYFESINQYDRKMLVEYAKIQKEIGDKEKDLVEQKETLEVLKGEVEQKTAEVYQEVIAGSNSLKAYTEEIAKKEAQALAYEEEIREKEEDIQTLQEQYKKELALSLESNAMGSRDLSDVVFGNGDIDLMAAIIECEAGGESYTGKVAVGAVVLNRVRSPKFPNTVLEVIMQKRQFSPVGSGRFSMVLARGANASCYQAAQDAMAGASPVGGCLFFRTPIPGLVGQQIGGHIFY